MWDKGFPGISLDSPKQAYWGASTGLSHQLFGDVAAGLASRRVVDRCNRLGGQPLPNIHSDQCVARLAECHTPATGRFSGCNRHLMLTPNTA